MPASDSRSDTVLVVEDERMLRAVLAAVLRAEGYQVVEATDAVEALDTLARHRAADDLCLVVLDMLLPRGSGLDVLSYLKASHSHVPVLAMSVDTSELVQASAAGADVVLAKPFEADQLVVVATSLANRYRQGQR